MDGSYRVVVGFSSRHASKRKQMEMESKGDYSEVNGSYSLCGLNLIGWINRWSESDVGMWMEVLWEFAQGEHPLCNRSETLDAPRRPERWRVLQPDAAELIGWTNVIDSQKWPRFILIFVPNESTAGLHRSLLSPAWLGLLDTSARIDKWTLTSISRRQTTLASISINRGDCQAILKRKLEKTGSYRTPTAHHPPTPTSLIPTSIPTHSRGKDIYIIQTSCIKLYEDDKILITTKS